MRTHVMELKVGDLLRDDVFNQAGLHVLPKGTTIRNDEIALLVRQSIDYVDVELQSEEGNRSEPKDEFVVALEGYQALFLEALTTGKFNQNMIEEKLKPVLEIIDQKKDVVSLLLTLSQDDINAYNHSLQVGLLSYYIASWLGYSRKECFEISKAGYLHDIGKSKIRQSIRNRTGELNDEELMELRRHTSYGYDIIKKSLPDESIALVALQHHEREDGTGYPHGLSKGEIHPYAQIVAVANTYVELTSPYGQRSKRDLLTVLRKVYELGFGKLSESAVQVLTNNLLPNFIGKKVKLSDGEIGTIVWNNPSDIFKPLVRTGESFRDLSRERNVELEEIMM